MSFFFLKPRIAAIIAIGHHRSAGINLLVLKNKALLLCAKVAHHAQLKHLVNAPGGGGGADVVSELTLLEVRGGRSECVRPTYLLMWWWSCPHTAYRYRGFGFDK